MALKIKDSGLRLRVERDLREEFVAACRAEGRTAAQVLRDCMRQFVDRARAGQKDLFAARGGEPIPKKKSPRTHAKQRRDRRSRSRP